MRDSGSASAGGCAAGECLSCFRGRRILIVGDVMLDEYLDGAVRRLSPEAPVPVVELESRTDFPGGAAHVAATVSALGAQPLLAGVTGDDESGRRLAHALRQRGVETTGLLTDPARPTTTKTRVVSAGRQVVRIDQESRQTVSVELEKQLLAWVEDRLSVADACVLSDYGKGVAVGRLAREFISRGRRAGKPVIIDPKGDETDVYCGGTVVKPNRVEAERLARMAIDSETALEQTGRKLLRLLEGSAVLITRGPEGMSLFRPGRETWHLPARARQVYDVTGAGDTVNAVLALVLAIGAGIEEAMDLANRAAALAVAKPGTATITVQELLDDW